jgi:hypothetical protein
VTAYSFAGFTTGHQGFSDGHMGAGPSADWYKVDLAAGMVKATVVNSAADVRALLFLYNPLGTEVMRADSFNGGAGASVMAPVMAGTHYLLVLAADPGPQSAAGSPTVSQSFTMPYTLTVSQ